MFSRVRCMYQGAICDDLSAYNRTHEMMSILTSNAHRHNDDVEGFGRRWDNKQYYPETSHKFVGGNADVGAQFDFLGIGPGASQTVSFKPMIGVLNQSKHLPLMWGGFVMEFEIIGDATETFADSVAGGHFTPSDTGSLCSLSDVRLVGDVVRLDSALQNSYAEHVLSGKSRNLHHNATNSSRF